MMLHSRSHRSLNYTAKEEGRTGNAPAVNHFVAIVDPKTGEVELIEGKKMVVRGVVRAKLAPASSAGEAEARMVSPRRCVEHVSRISKILIFLTDVVGSPHRSRPNIWYKESQKGSARECSQRHNTTNERRGISIEN